jgi:hypothetical protein
VLAHRRTRGYTIPSRRSIARPSPAHARRARPSTSSASPILRNAFPAVVTPFDVTCEHSVYWRCGRARARAQARGLRRSRRPHGPLAGNGNVGGDGADSALSAPCRQCLAGRRRIRRAGPSRTVPVPGTAFPSPSTDTPNLVGPEALLRRPHPCPSPGDWNRPSPEMPQTNAPEPAPVPAQACPVPATVPVPSDGNAPGHRQVATPAPHGKVATHAPAPVPAKWV